MEANQDTKSLEMRIVELENQLKQLRADRASTDISAEEFNAYLKVISVLGCIRECTCGPCACGSACSFFGGLIQPGLIHRCIFECNPGCNIDPRFPGGGGGRFGGLGG